MNEMVLLMRRAKEQLSGKWGSAAIATLIYLALMAVAGSTYVLELIVFGPLQFGYILYLSCLVDTNQNNLNLLFKGVQRIGDTLVAGILYMLAVGVGYFLLIVPGIILACGFSMTFFIMVDNPNISGIDALKESWNMMRGHKWEFFCLWLRFLGWLILCVLTVGIGYIWLSPYMTATFLNYYRKLRYGTF